MFKSLINYQEVEKVSFQLYERPKCPIIPLRSSMVSAEEGWKLCAAFLALTVQSNVLLSGRTQGVHVCTLSHSRITLRSMGTVGCTQSHAFTYRIIFRERFIPSLKEKNLGFEHFMKKQRLVLASVSRFCKFELCAVILRQSSGLSL